MPYVSLSTSKTIDESTRNKLREAIGESISIIPNKSYEVTMMRFDGNCDMVKGREPADCLFMEIRLYSKTTRAAKRAFTEAISEKLCEILGVEQKMMYINYLEFDGWGANGAYKEVGE